MNYPKGFFDLNLRFAQKVAELSGQPFEIALLHDTNLYIRFGLGRDFDATNSSWQEYLAGLHLQKFQRPGQRIGRAAA